MPSASEPIPHAPHEAHESFGRKNSLSRGSPKSPIWRTGIPPREWHSYIILHDAYVEDVPNRDIMSQLYVSEGTFHRQRRKALRAVARSLLEARRPAPAVSLGNLAPVDPATGV